MCSSMLTVPSTAARVHTPDGFVAAAQSLRAIAGALRPCGPKAAFYLAAAVSDFYVPWPRMVRAVDQRDD